MSMDYEAIRAGIETGVPFNRHVGLRVAEIGSGRARVLLPDVPHMRNHVGGQHGSAIYLVAEATCGGAVFGAFAEQIERYLPLAETGSIRYVKPARGELEASAELDADPAGLMKLADRDGRVRFETACLVRDPEGDVVADAVYGWHLRRTDDETDWTARATSDPEVWARRDRGR